MPIIPIKDCGSKGVNKDLLPSELELGWWSDSLNFRFRNGFAEKWGGVRQILSSASAPPKWMQIYGTPSNRFLFYAYKTTAYAYSPSAATTYTLTSYRNAETISTLTRISGTVAELTTSAVHGLTTGDKVSVFGATESGYNITEVSITVMSTTVFRYTVASIALNASVVGQYIVFSSSATSGFSSGDLDKITGGLLNGILFVNTPTDGIYYWAADTSAKLRRFPFVTYVADVARSFGNYIIQLAPTISGTKYPYDVIWSNAAEPGSGPTTFAAASTNDAGRFPLAETDGKLVDCLPLGETNIIYKQDCYYTQQHVEGTLVFDFTRVPQSDGLLAANCVVNTPKGHVFVTPSLDIKIHQGGASTSIANGVVQEYFSTAIPSAGVDVKNGCFLCVNPVKKEVWVCFPIAEQSVAFTCHRVLAWNWVDNTWSILDVSGRPLLSASTGIWPYTSTDDRETLIVGVSDYSSDSRIGDASHITDGTYFASTVTGTLERTGMHFDDVDSFKTLDRSRWNFNSTANKTPTVYHGSSVTADGTTTYTAGATYTMGTTDYVNQRATSGRFCAIKLSTTAYPLLVRSIDLDVKKDGKR